VPIKVIEMWGLFWVQDPRKSWYNFDEDLKYLNHRKLSKNRFPGKSKTDESRNERISNFPSLSLIKKSASTYKKLPRISNLEIDSRKPSQNHKIPAEQLVNSLYSLVNSNLANKKT
jgi:hypothetical protein